MTPSAQEATQVPDSQDDNKTGETTEEAPEGTEETTEEAQKGAEEEGREEKPKLSPEAMEAEVTKTRAEAANYRVKLREAEKRLESAKSIEEVEEIVTGMKVEREAAERALIVENVALRFNLPDELAELLQGSSREELETHAKKLQKFAPDAQAGDPDLDDLSGGLDPNNRDSDPSDPGALANRHAPRRR